MPKTDFNTFLEEANLAPEHDSFYDLLEGMELTDDDANPTVPAVTVPVEDLEESTLVCINLAVAESDYRGAPESDQGPSQDWVAPSFDDWSTTMGENDGLASSTQEYGEFRNSTIQIEAPRERWISSNILGKRRAVYDEPEASDEPEIAVSKRRITGSVWGMEMRAGRAAALRTTAPPKRRGLNDRSEKRVTKEEEAESLAAISEAGGAATFLKQLSADLAAPNQASFDPEPREALDAHTQRTDTYSFNKPARSFYGR